MNDAPADDLIASSVLFVIVLLVSSLVFWVARLAVARWGPREPEPSMEERARSAVLHLQSVGVDVSGLLGEWSPAECEDLLSAGARR
ncbi:hypothetical protein ACRYCC_04095 [Actinomadura scrupuli]|uniref:hypothetical protein n=1 Tax=Actinomadura scrupuli TaxID=559629 RepID=UPI003D983FB3